MRRAVRLALIIGVLLFVVPALLLHRACNPASERAARETEQSIPGVQLPPPR